MTEHWGGVGALELVKTSWIQGCRTAGGLAGTEFLCRFLNNQVSKKGNITARENTFEMATNAPTQFSWKRVPRLAKVTVRKKQDKRTTG